MLSFFKTLLVGFLLLLIQSVQAAEKEYPKTEEALNQAFDELVWEIEAKKHSLTNSPEEYQLPEGLAILLGEDAQQFLFLNNGTEFPEINALVVDPVTFEQVTFSYDETGYVEDDDWSDLDADLLLEGIIESTNEANSERIKNGMSLLEVVGWVQKPVYDETTRTAYWAIKATDKTEGDIVNAIALKLGREGFTKFTWIGEPDQFNPAKGLLTDTLQNHNFEDGFLYADYSTGDKVAAFGLASLVAVSAGSKSGKGAVAGIFAMILIFAKKLWFLILVPFVLVWKKVKSFFTGQQIS